MVEANEKSGPGIWLARGTQTLNSALEKKFKIQKLSQEMRLKLNYCYITQFEN